ncbi:hypothetical protein TNCV_1959571 [Trichonephila clavipes]|nr:hypothetical protein TNCV_1959571 [Trichonephila clavipes]
MEKGKEERQRTRWMDKVDKCLKDLGLTDGRTWHQIDQEGLRQGWVDFSRSFIRGNDYSVIAKAVTRKCLGGLPDDRDRLNALPCIKLAEIALAGNRL